MHPLLKKILDPPVHSEFHKLQKCREIEYFYSFRILFLFELYTSPSSFNRSGSYIVHTRVNLFRHESIVNVFFLLVDFSYCFTFLIFPKNPSDQNSCYRSTSTSTPYVTMATVRGGHSVSLHLPITSPIKHLTIIYPRWRTKRRMTSCPSFAVILS